MKNSKPVLSHIFDDTITLDELQGRYQLSSNEEVNSLHRYSNIESYKNFLNEDMLINTIICKNVEIVDLIPYVTELYRSLSDEETKVIMDSVKDTIKEQPYFIITDFTSIENISNEDRAKGRYLINYYFNSPLETKEEKLNIIKNMSTLTLPKKYIYDLKEDKEVSPGKRLSANDKELLHFRFNEKENWKIVYKPLLEEYYLKSGIDEIEKFYYNIPLVDKSQDLKASHINNKFKYKEYNCFRYIILFKPINELIYDNPGFTSYKDIFNSSIEIFKNRVNDYTKTLKSISKDLDNCLTKLSLSVDGVKEKIYNGLNDELKKELASVDDMYNEDYNKYPNDSSNSLDIYKNAKKGSVEYTYYLIIKDRYTRKMINLNKHNILRNMKELEAINTPGTIEAYYQEISLIFFSGEFHKRNFEIIEQKKEKEKGNTPLYVNNIVNGLWQVNTSFKSLTPTQEKEFNPKIDTLKQLKRRLEDLKKVNTIGLDYEEVTRINSNISSIEETIKDIEAMLKRSNIVIYKDEVKQILITGPRSNEYNWELVNDELFINLEDFILRRDMAYTILTRKNKKKYYESRELLELTPKLADKFSHFVTLIIKEASRNIYNNILYFDIDELLQELGYSQKNKIEAIKSLRLFIEILKTQCLESIKLKGKAKKDINIPTTFNFIGDSGIVDDNKLMISLGNMFKTIVEANTSKLWIKDNVRYNSSPEQLLAIVTQNYLNQNKPSETGETSLTRSISINALISPIASLKEKENSKKLQRDLYNPLWEYMDNINENQYASVYYKIPRDLRSVKDSNGLNSKVEIGFRVSDKPQKFINRENSKKK